MKAQQLLDILQAEINSDPSIGDNEVVIAIEGTSDQYTHDLEPILNAGAGIDMTQDKFIIFSKNTLNIKKNKS